MGSTVNKYIGKVVLCMAATLLAGCGGGGGSAGNTGFGGSAGGGTAGGGATTAGAPTAINFVTATPADKSIVIKGAGGNGRTEAALLTFSVVDSSNVVVPNVAVSFTTQSTYPVTLSSSSGTTDVNGNVTVAVNSGTQPTTVRVVATVQGTSITALSDIVTVTTGQPTQTAFSLSREKAYVEGFSFDNTQNSITALLADQFGAAVADGTQVVFTTDSGAIVGEGGARCLTVDGGCSVNWRSQNPRTSNGVVTVVATATSGSSNLSTSLRFFNSGSAAAAYRVTGTQGATTRLGAANTAVALDFSASCDAQAISIELVDVNGNPLPEGTSISGEQASNASMTAFPSTVMNTGVPFDSTNRGTVHSVSVTPSGCEVGGVVPKTGSILIATTTPLGVISSTLTIQLAFTGN